MQTPLGDLSGRHITLRQGKEHGGAKTVQPEGLTELARLPWERLEQGWEQGWEHLVPETPTQPNPAGDIHRLAGTVYDGIWDQRETGYR